MKQHTLLLDANYFLYSRLFVIPGGTISDPLFSKEKERGIFIRKLATDFSSEIRKMSSFINKIVVCMDSKSWRKELINDVEYKGNRVKTETIVWDVVYELFNEFCNELKKLGVQFSQVERAEADDLIYLWRSHLNSKGENVIIWSGDRDLLQLVCYLPYNNTYTLWYDNTRSKFGVYPGFLKWLQNENKSNDSTNIFDMKVDNLVASSFENFIKHNSIKIMDVFADEFVFHKILMGDSSDNVPSVVNWTTTSKNGNTRNYGISEKMSYKILEAFKKDLKYGNFITNYLFNEECLNDIVMLIKQIVGKLETEVIKHNLFRNIKLILLHNETLPKDLQQNIFDNIEYVEQFDSRVDFTKITTMQGILENTQWVKKEYKNITPNSLNPFDGLDAELDIDNEFSKLF